MKKLSLEEMLRLTSADYWSAVNERLTGGLEGLFFIVRVADVHRFYELMKNGQTLEKMLGVQMMNFPACMAADQSYKTGLLLMAHL